MCFSRLLLRDIADVICRYLQVSYPFFFTNIYTLLTLQENIYYFLWSFVYAMFFFFLFHAEFATSVYISPSL